MGDGMSRLEAAKFWDFKGRVVFKDSEIVSVKVFSYQTDAAKAEKLAESRILSGKCDWLSGLLEIRDSHPEFIGLIEGRVLEDGDMEVVYISRIQLESQR